MNVRLSFLAWQKNQMVSKAQKAAGPTPFERSSPGRGQDGISSHHCKGGAKFSKACYNHDKFPPDMIQRLEDELVVDPTAFSGVRWWGQAS